MISIEKIRELIPDSEKYSDEEMEKINNDLHALADILFDLWLKERNSRPDK